MQISNEFGKSLEGKLRVIEEVSIVLHVINVRPHDIEREVIVSVAIKNTLQNS